MGLDGMSGGERKLREKVYIETLGCSKIKSKIYCDWNQADAEAYSVHTSSVDINENVLAIKEVRT